MPRPQRPSDSFGPLETSKQTFEALIGLESHLDQLLEPVKVDLQKILDRVGGRSFSSFQGNRRVLRQLLRLLDRLNLSLECQYPGCGKPARLRCLTSKGSKPWKFEFEHRIEGKLFRHYCEPKFPLLKLVRLKDEDVPRRGRPSGDES